MKISARNKLKGRVAGLEPGALNCLVKIELDAKPVITAMVTNEAVAELELSIGCEACAVVKSSNVLVGVCNEGAGCGSQAPSVGG